MNTKALLAVAVALVALQLASSHPVKRSCACNLRGTDVCNGGPQCTAVRPVRPRTPQGYQRVIYQKYAAPEFKPQSVCTCEGGLVTAPEVPRVPCKVHHGSPCQAQNYATPGSYASLLGGGPDCEDAPANPCEEGSYNPINVRTYTIPAEDNLPTEELEEVPVPNAPTVQAADAVSLALAYQMATRSQKNVLEENLAFGPMQTVKEGRIVQKKKYVPEAGLYAVRNQVVELKAPPTFGSNSCDDEADAALLAAQQSSCGDEEDTGYGAPLPSYRDLGFAPVAGECNFVPGQYQPAPQVVQTVEYTVPAPVKEAPAASYSSCDALGEIERGRGYSGPDYYGADAPQEELAESDTYDNCADSGSSYSVAVPPVAVPVHTGRPSCGCGCRRAY